MRSDDHRITGNAPIDETGFAGDGASALLAGRYGLRGGALYDLEAGTAICPA